MLFSISALVVFLAAASPADEHRAPLEQTLPATDLNRESNNPAKAAIKAKEAVARDRAEQKLAVDDATAPQLGPVANVQELVATVEAALREDARTAKLGIVARLEQNGKIGLHGGVPSEDGRNAAIEVARKVAGALRVESFLTLPKNN